MKETNYSEHHSLLLNDSLVAQFHLAPLYLQKAWTLAVAKAHGGPVLQI